MFIKCLHASKLSREEISNEVVVTECFKQPLNHLELITCEVYLPLLDVANVASSAQLVADN